MKKNVTGCSVETAMNVLGGRWRAVVIFHLLRGTQRFSELRRAIPKISQRMLTLDLRELERTGIVKRTVFAEVPLRVEYELTPLGQSLRPVIDAVCKWGRLHEASMQEPALAKAKA